MYDYISLRIDISPCNEDTADLMAAFLADLDFETFEPDTKGLTAYVRKDRYRPDEVKEMLKTFPIDCRKELKETEIKGEDWNREWEQNYFKPILIDGKLVIRSSFHSEYPKAPVEIIIDPKMAFGTGHHATTAGMSRLILEEDMKGKTVIDMGTGTGILAILAKKSGALDTVGIDIDEFAVDNARENGCLNEVDVKWITGDDKALENLDPADIFFANINLNVILDNLHKYVKKLKSGGSIFLSGFLDSDRDSIIQEAQNNGLKLKKEAVENHWETMQFKKEL